MEVSMRYGHILAIDPSGAYEEGQGITGWCLMHHNDKDKQLFIDTGYIDSGKFISALAYWTVHTKLIQNKAALYPDDLIVVIEDYILYEDKAESQIHSKMETVRLIGILEYFCYVNHIPFKLQTANTVVNRWNNTVLLHKNIIVETQPKYFMLPNNNFRLNRHILDSIRHATHFATFRNKEVSK